MKGFFSKKILPLFVFLIALLSLTSKPINAQAMLFQDNFDNDPEGSIPSDWVISRNKQWGNSAMTCYYQGNPTTWEIRDGTLGIKIKGPGCVTEIIPETFELGESINNYVYEFDMAMPNSVNVDRNFVFKYKDPENWYGFHLIRNNVIFQKPIGNYYRQIYAYYSFVANQTYHFRVEVNENQIRLLINDSLVTTIEDSEPYLSEATIGLQASVGAISNSEVYFDNVVVCDDPTQPCGETTPTLDPLIFLPGFGASWNTEGMIGGQTDILPEQWKMTPFVKCYDGLIKSLEDTGYEQGTNFFVYNYDWRRPLDDAAKQLRDFIDQNISDPNTKVDLVGHSLGGLVARTYSQKYGTDKIDQLITLGSPHEGAVHVYRIWQGAQIDDRLNWGQVALQLLLQIHNIRFQTEVETIRQLAPSLKDIMPIFNFLKKGSTEIDWQTQNQKNDYLHGLKNNVSQIFDQLLAVFGTSSDTARWYQVENRSTIDRLLGKWEDGKPIATDSENGDQTILASSAQASPDPAESINLNHRGLIEQKTGIEKVFEILELSPDNIVELPILNRTNTLVFLLASPAQLKVTAPGQTEFLSDEDGFVIINEPASGEYKTEIVPLNGGGDYHLYLGQLMQNEDLWSQIKDEVGPDETDVFQFEINADSPLANPLVDTNGLYYLRLVKSRLTPLNLSSRTMNYLNSAIDLAENHQYSQSKSKVERLINYLFGERKKKTSLQDKKEIYLAILDLTQAYTKLCQAGSISFNQRSEQRNLQLTEKLLNIYRRRIEVFDRRGKATSSQAASFEKAEENLALAQESYPTNLPATHTYSVITRYLLYEIR